MPRVRRASPEEIRTAIRAAGLRFRDALLQPGAPKTIRLRMKQLSREYQVWNGTLALLRTKARRELSEQLTRDVDQVARKCRDMRIRADDLAALEEYFGKLADTVRGADIEPSPSPRLFRFLARLARSKPAVPRSLKPLYVEAYRRQQAARAEGRILTAETLARELLPTRFECNPESTIRSMQRGLKRVGLRMQTSTASPRLAEGERHNSQ